MLFWRGKMTTNKSEKGFVWGKAEPMKGARLAEYRQAPYDAELQYADYGKKTPHGEINHIKPKSRSGSDNIINLQDLRWQTISEKSEVRMKRGRHSKLNT